MDSYNSSNHLRHSTKSLLNTERTVCVYNNQSKCKPVIIHKIICYSMMLRITVLQKETSLYKRRESITEYVPSAMFRI